MCNILQHEYLNEETLIQRLQAVAKNMDGTLQSVLLDHPVATYEYVFSDHGDLSQYKPQKLNELCVSSNLESTVRDNYGSFDNSKVMLPPKKRRKMEHAFGVSFINNSISNLPAPKMVQPCTPEGTTDLHQQPQSPIFMNYEVTEGNMELFTNPKQESMSISKIKNNVIDDSFGQTSKTETILYEGFDGCQTSEELLAKSHHVMTNNNLKECMHTLHNDPSAEIENVKGGTEFNKAGKNATNEVMEPKAELEKETKSSNPTVNGVSLTEFLTCDQIREHVMSFKQQFGQVSTQSFNVCLYLYI